MGVCGCLYPRPGGCPACQSWTWDWPHNVQPPTGWPLVPIPLPSAPVGCICPPGSEKTCMAQYCHRRGGQLTDAQAHANSLR